VDARDCLDDIRTIIAAMTPSLTAARVAIVSGKGGVGKTTVAAAVAIAAARAGKHVLLAELEDREAFAPIFGLKKLAYTEQALAPNITGFTIEADEALVDYLRLFYGIPTVSRTLIRTRAFEFATSTAPGLKDILLIGKIKEAERRRHDGRYTFDLIVLDAPPTGRLPRFLDAPRVVVELVHGGPIRAQAQGVLDMVTDPKRCQVVLVTQPEDMPVRETAESVETLSKMGVALGPVVMNGVWPPLPPLGKDARATLRKEAEAAGLALPDESIDELADVATAHARRARNQRKAMKTLADEVSLPHVELPYLFTERMGKAEIDLLARHLTEVGAL
jgi:anion-transporting  ArsA/GET3 family ATPase